MSSKHRARSEHSFRFLDSEQRIIASKVIKRYVLD
jgi:translation initiation factor RLI1